MKFYITHMAICLYVLATKQRGVPFYQYHWKGKCLGFRHIANIRQETDNENNSSYILYNQ